MPFDSSFMAASGARGVERNGMVTGLEQNPSTVLVAARARVYHTKLNTKDSQWVYSRWKGTLTFGKDIETPNSIPRDISDTERHWFRLADDETGRTVWMFKFPEQFEYGVDRPFFHVFQGRVRAVLQTRCSNNWVDKCNRLDDMDSCSMTMMMRRCSERWSWRDFLMAVGPLSSPYNTYGLISFTNAMQNPQGNLEPIAPREAARRGRSHLVARSRAL